ncbi:hypothetical protein G4Y79_07600 [Phototrophicus methaneseepsis]|uniref:SH3 domain-containing protein n=1 Tax=Phototrophicus methaneseepsis TaxID=2710758 RepID=A0A7S8EC42_9CHLR|nr:hypothetical protein [Phototrophicus methaneseepsis]QPC84227.1 hypothetical protein G4Y79_07600 [Phototrophicus methaneseepsis]
MHSTMQHSTRIMRPLALFIVIAMLVWPAAAQDEDEDDDYPRPIAPGETILPIEDLALENGCFAPFPLVAGDLIYIEPGVNIRNGPSQSSALVWNTIYDNLDDRGNVVDNPVYVDAVIVGGPVCAEGLNWWQITGTSNPGWVAEGRRDYEGGYWITAPGTEYRGICDGIYDLQTGEVVDLTYNARIREAPTTQALTKTIVPNENPVTIISGPQCVDGVLWWYVRATVVNVQYEGWMAEGENEVAYLVPEDLEVPSLEDGTLCATPYEILSVGIRGYVNYHDNKPKSLRATPGTDSTLLFTLVDGVPFVIEGGPVCADNMNWWQIRILASTEVVGWMSEGSPSAGYWMSRINPDEYRYSNPPGTRED